MLEGQELEEFTNDFGNQMIAAGKTFEEASELVDEYVENQKEILDFKKVIKVPRFLPIRYIQEEIDKSVCEDISEDDSINAVLFEAGFDTKNFSWVVNICCYKWNGKQECGRVVLGSERLDTEWAVSGNRSDDAFHYLTRDL